MTDVLTTIGEADFYSFAAKTRGYDYVQQNRPCRVLHPLDQSPDHCPQKERRLRQGDEKLPPRCDLCTYASADQERMVETLERRGYIVVEGPTMTDGSITTKLNKSTLGETGLSHTGGRVVLIFRPLR